MSDLIDGGVHPQPRLDDDERRDHLNPGRTRKGHALSSRGPFTISPGTPLCVLLLTFLLSFSLSFSSSPSASSSYLVEGKIHRHANFTLYPVKQEGRPSPLVELMKYQPKPKHNGRSHLATPVNAAQAASSPSSSSSLPSSAEPASSRKRGKKQVKAAAAEASTSPTLLTRLWNTARRLLQLPTNSSSSSGDNQPYLTGSIGVSDGAGNSELEEDREKDPTNQNDDDDGYNPYLNFNGTITSDPTSEPSTPILDQEGSEELDSSTGAASPKQDDQDMEDSQTGKPIGSNTLKKPPTFDHVPFVNESDPLAAKDDDQLGVQAAEVRRTSANISVHKLNLWDVFSPDSADAKMQHGHLIRLDNPSHHFSFFPPRGGCAATKENGGLERTSENAKRNKCRVATNAGFFNTKRPEKFSDPFTRNCYNGLITRDGKFIQKQHSRYVSQQFSRNVHFGLTSHHHFFVGYLTQEMWEKHLRADSQLPKDIDLKTEKIIKDEEKRIAALQQQIRNQQQSSIYDQFLAGLHNSNSTNRHRHGATGGKNTGNGSKYNWHNVTGTTGGSASSSKSNSTTPGKSKGSNKSAKLIRRNGQSYRVKTIPAANRKLLKSEELSSSTSESLLDSKSSSTGLGSPPAVNLTELTKLDYVPLHPDATDWHFTTLIGGALWLVRDGHNYIEQSIRDGEDLTVEQSECPREEHCEKEVHHSGVKRDHHFIHLKAARTAIGHTRDGALIIVSIDGARSHEGLGEDELQKAGVTLYDMASLLISFGALNAINLDGGGSATVVVDGVVANYPSDINSLPTQVLADGSLWDSQDSFVAGEREVSSITCIHDDYDENEVIDLATTTGVDSSVIDSSTGAASSTSTFPSSSTGSTAAQSSTGAAATSTAASSSSSTAGSGSATGSSTPIGTMNVSFNSSASVNTTLQGSSEAAEAQATADAIARAFEMEQQRLREKEQHDLEVQQLQEELRMEEERNKWLKNPIALVILLCAMLVLTLAACAIGRFGWSRLPALFQRKKGFERLSSADEDTFDGNQRKRSTRVISATDDPSTSPVSVEIDVDVDRMDSPLDERPSPVDSPSPIRLVSKPVNEAKTLRGSSARSSSNKHSPTKPTPISPPPDATPFELGELCESEGEEEEHKYTTKHEVIEHAED